MTKNWDAQIVAYRTPAEHRAMIQGVSAPPAYVDPKEKAAPKKWHNLKGHSSYSEYLKSYQWVETKAKWMASKKCKGEICHAKNCKNTKLLSLHHRTYARVGRERLSDLVLVCRGCHKKIHNLERKGKSLDIATLIIVGK